MTRTVRAVSDVSNTGTERLEAQKKVTTIIVFRLLTTVKVVRKIPSDAGICPFSNDKIFKVNVTLAVVGTVYFPKALEPF